MIENIEITTGVAIVSLSWICCTLYAIIRKDIKALETPFWITIAYGVFRAYLIGYSIGLLPIK